MNNLVDRLEVWGFENNTLVFRDGSLGTCLKLAGLDVSCKEDEFLNDLHGKSVDFLNGLPGGLSLQFVQEVTSEGEARLIEHASCVDSEASEIAKSLTKERVEKFTALSKSGELLKQNSYLFLRKPIEQKFVQRKKLFNYFKQKKNEEIPEAILKREIEKFKGIITQVVNGLDVLEIKAQELLPSETFKLLYDQWNPASLQAPPDNIFLDDFRDQLITTDAVIHHSGFNLGKTNHRILSLKIMPDYTFSSMIEKLRELPFNSKLFLTVKVLDQGRERTILETQRRIAYAMAVGGRGRVSDVDSEAKLKDIESLLGEMVAGQERLFEVGLNIVIRGESESSLDDTASLVLQKMRELSGAEGMQETLASFDIFSSFSMPNARALERTRKMNSSNLANFLPIYASWEGHKTPRILLRNRFGSLLSFDPFSPDNTNFNQIVSGGSGSGKSFLVGLLLNQMLKEKPKVFILDVGGSYKRSCENLDGQYIPLGASSAVSINPFDVGGLSTGMMDQKIKFLVSLVEIMTKESDSKTLGKLERSELENLIQKVYQDKPEPKLSDLRELLIAHPDPTLVRLGKILSSWCGQSPYGKFVDHKTTIELSKNVVCFDLKGLEQFPDLQSACLFMIFDLVWREVQKDQTSVKFCVMDECWRLLENEQGSQFIGEIFRTFRKYRASAIAISQTVDDFAKSKVASAIIPNSSIKWLLKQTGANMKQLAETLALNSREIELISSIRSEKGKFSEAFLVCENQRQLVVIEPTPLEYWLGTTDPRDLKLIEDYKLNEPTALGFDVIKKLAKEYPKGASGPKRAEDLSEKAS